MVVDGKRIVSFLTLAIMKDGATVTTIEGLASGAQCPAIGLKAIMLVSRDTDGLYVGDFRRGQRGPNAAEIERTVAMFYIQSDIRIELTANATSPAVWLKLKRSGGASTDPENRSQPRARNSSQRQKSDVRVFGELRESGGLTTLCQDCRNIHPRFKSGRRLQS